MAHTLKIIQNKMIITPHTVRFTHRSQHVSVDYEYVAKLPTDCPVLDSCRLCNLINTQFIRCGSNNKGKVF
jgi:hypothetical protein